MIVQKATNEVHQTLEYSGKYFRDKSIHEVLFQFLFQGSGNQEKNVLTFKIAGLEKLFPRQMGKLSYMVVKKMHGNQDTPKVTSSFDVADPIEFFI